MLLLWVQTLTLTESAEKDRIKEHFNSTKQLQDIVYSFLANPSGVFHFDILDNVELMDMFNESPEIFVTRVKQSVIEYVTTISQKQLKDVVKAMRSFTVKITDASHLKLNEWSPEYEGIPVSVECLVMAMHKRETYIKSINTICYGCRHQAILTPDVVTGEIGTAPRCMNEDCDHYKQDYKIQPESIKTSYIQKIIIEEPMEEAKHGQPVVFNCEIKDNDILTTHLGQRIKVIGYFRSVINLEKTTNEIIIKSINTMPAEEVDQILPEPQNLNAYKQLAKEGDIIEHLTESFSPEIYGEKLAKEAVIISLLGGTKQGRLRGRIHCILIGDPSVGKTKILEFVTMVTQGSAYVNGGMSSAAGLTVGMDTVEGKRIPRAGPVAKCSGSFVCIDEMSRMRKEDLASLHDAMEDGHIHYTKGGYDLHILADTTIISAANPKADRYRPAFSVVDNIGLPETILSRDDLKVLMRDIPDTIEDTRKFDHILMMRNPATRKPDVMSVKEITGFLNYARKIEPTMGEDAEIKAKKFYLSLRVLDQDEKSIPIDTRLGEAILRIATAYAKWHLSTTVTDKHIDLAIELYKQTLQSFGMRTDENMTQLNMTDSVTSKEQAFLEVWRTMEKDSEDGYILEEEFLILLHKTHGTHFNTVDKAQKAFDERYEKRQIIKKGGRYKLL